MNRVMTRQAARAFRARWKALNDFELRELRRMAPAEKFRQLEALILSAAAFGWSGEDREASETVRSRWNRLRERSRG